MCAGTRPRVEVWRDRSERVLWLRFLPEYQRRHRRNSDNCADAVQVSAQHVDQPQKPPGNRVFSEGVLRYIDTNTRVWFLKMLFVACMFLLKRLLCFMRIIKLVL